MTCYDEAGLVRKAAAEAGLPVDAPVRVSVPVGDGARISALRWGTESPELVLLHGGGQNAHTWDVVMLAMSRPAVALDLPGHGHSSWRDDHDYAPRRIAPDVAAAVEQLAPAARAVVGMSLGGAVGVLLAADRPDLVRRLVLVDFAPGPPAPEVHGYLDRILDVPQSFTNVEDVIQRLRTSKPDRSLYSLRRGALHNSKPTADGSWTWRYDLRGIRRLATELSPVETRLWDDVGRIAVPVLVVRGADSGAVPPEAAARFEMCLCDVRVETVAGAGHSVQGDRPLELAELMRKFVYGAKQTANEQVGIQRRLRETGHDSTRH